MDNERGYSLTELAIALSLVGILLAAGFSSLRRAHAGEEVDGWARSLTSDLATARETAASQRTAVSVTLTDASYVIATRGGTTLRSATLPSDISVTTTCPSSVCAFDPWGAPTAAGTVTLTSASAGRAYVITIQPGTGSVSYQ